MAKIISILNHKGGVGKTTTTLNLAYHLGKMGKKILIIDLDPQGTSTSTFGIDKNEIPNSYSFARILLKAKPAIKTMKSPYYENVYIVPSTMELITTSYVLEQKKKNLNEIMKTIINGIQKNYDYIFFDCPPSFGNLNLAALGCSDSVLIPTQCEYFAAEGLTQLMAYIRKIKNLLNPKLKIEGILMTMFDSRNKISIEVYKEIKQTFKEGIYNTVIPRNVKLVEAAMRNSPIAKYSPNSKGAIAYKKFTKEFVQHNA